MVISVVLAGKTPPSFLHTRPKQGPSPYAFAASERGLMDRTAETPDRAETSAASRESLRTAWKQSYPRPRPAP
ncbi:hypothetical protein PtB15_11B367 [Puccinia triticina]|nr:hypothetical protein PtB15_11B367 [Puccinia triticina]